MGVVARLLPHRGAPGVGTGPVEDASSSTTSSARRLRRQLPARLGSRLRGWLFVHPGRRRTPLGVTERASRLAPACCRSATFPAGFGGEGAAQSIDRYGNALRGSTEPHGTSFACSFPSSCRHSNEKAAWRSAFAKPVQGSDPVCARGAGNDFLGEQRVRVARTYRCTSRRSRSLASSRSSTER